jgi:hypothetical protein
MRAVVDHEPLFSIGLPLHQQLAAPTSTVGINSWLPLPGRLSLMAAFEAWLAISIRCRRSLRDLTCTVTGVFPGSTSPVFECSTGTQTGLPCKILACSSGLCAEGVANAAALVPSIVSLKTNPPPHHHHPQRKDEILRLLDSTHLPISPHGHHALPPSPLLSPGSPAGPGSSTRSP